MKKITTSAQKTVFGDKPETLRKLLDAVSKYTCACLLPTSNAFIHSGKLKDGTNLKAAVFDKGNGIVIAMLDNSGVPQTDRDRHQKKWRKLLDTLFARGG